MAIPEARLLPGFGRYISSDIRGKRMRTNIDHLPSNLREGELTILRIPKLDTTQCLVPDSMHLCFDLVVSGTKSWFKNNLARLLVKDLRVQMSNRTLYDCNDEYCYRVYEDLWKTDTERDSMTEYGLANENLRKILSGDDSGATSGDADKVSDKLIHDTYGKRMRIKVSNILENQGLHAPRTMNNDFQFLIRLPKSSDILVAQSGETIGTYSLESVTHEFETIDSPKLFENATSLASSGYKLHYKEMALENIYDWGEALTQVNVLVNTPRQSMQAIILLFTSDSPTDSEEYVYPEIESVRVTIEGVSNSLYNNTIPQSRFFEEAKRFFGHKVESAMNLRNFYKDKFALVIDLRTVPDAMVRGNGRYVMNTQRGVQLSIAKRAHTGKGDLKCRVYVQSDAYADIMNNNLQDVQR